MKGNVAEKLENDEIAKYLIFNIGSEWYGTPLMDVREVIEYHKPKAVPNTQPHFSGVINLRGSIVGVVDMRLKFGVSVVPESPSVFLVCDTEQGPLAAIVDRVNSVLAIDEENIERSVPTLNKIHKSYLHGIARQEDQLISIIKLANILSLENVVNGT